MGIQLAGYIKSLILNKVSMELILDLGEIRMCIEVLKH